ncbi:Acetyl esterase/lipase [Mucilaginibacter mallensis]|uniref:Acetyl esterase/lipase n=2 Tax=Mucilaginibacter mallensis TaxID=652787 RepID=A0A1H1TEP5_MUCMA|nr:Acetyl esterase/lipase [Mucilaginibacter mallensis]
MIFTETTVDIDQSYNPAATKDEKKAYLFDLYQPKGDDARHRPLIIWMHGGGFKFGSKDAKGVALWSKTFAQRGYVCANINYRLSKKNPLFHFDELVKSSYYAVQDVKIAVEYFKHNAARYGIDPDKIVLAGNSAGGMIALQAAYSSNEELAKLAGLSNDTAAINKPQERVKVAAVINFWGAIYNLDWLKNVQVPIVSVLGSNDGVVPPTHKSAPLYGGEDIHAKADSLGIPNELKVFEGYSHELQKHFNPVFPVGEDTEKRWLQAGQFAADFLYNTLFK